MRIRLLVSALSAFALLACGFADLFSSRQVGDVVITYNGPIMLRVDDTVPFTVSVTIAGAPVSNPRLFISTFDNTILALTATGDTLVGKARGFDTLTIKLVASIYTDSFPTLRQPVRVNP